MEEINWYGHEMSLCIISPKQDMCLAAISREWMVSKCHADRPTKFRSSTYTGHEFVIPNALAPNISMSSVDIMLPIKVRHDDFKEAVDARNF